MLFINAFRSGEIDGGQGASRLPGKLNVLNGPL